MESLIRTLDRQVGKQASLLKSFPYIPSPMQWRVSVVVSHLRLCMQRPFLPPCVFSMHVGQFFNYNGGTILVFGSTQDFNLFNFWGFFSGGLCLTFSLVPSVTRAIGKGVTARKNTAEVHLQQNSSIFTFYQVASFQIRVKTSNITLITSISSS